MHNNSKREKAYNTFVIKANALYDSKYHYTDYKSGREPIDVVCPHHGEFATTPEAHLRGNECPTCTSKIKTATYISQATARHNGRYSYPNTVFEAHNVEVSVVCSKHGEFFQKASAHLSGKGCASCAGHNNDTKAFVDRANIVHNNLYDYSETVYVKRFAKVTIKCNTHGTFEQTAADHLKGNGCPVCANESRREKMVMSFSDFLVKAKQAYGNAFEYDESSYVDGSTKMQITCPEHGSFECTPSLHLNNKKRGLSNGGCPKCSDKPARIAFDDFVSRAKTVHGEKYQYVESTYSLLTEKVDIVCKDHGVFSQNASNHVNRSSGCPKCALGGE